MDALKRNSEVNNKNTLSRFGVFRKMRNTISSLAVLIAVNSCISENRRAIGDTVDLDTNSSETIDNDTTINIDAVSPIDTVLTDLTDTIDFSDSEDLNDSEIADTFDIEEILDTEDSVDTSVGPKCKNGVLESGEDCDLSQFAGSDNCADIDPASYNMGKLKCTDTCKLDVSNCSFCGDDVKEGTEACDGDDLDNLRCEDVNALIGGLQFNRGTLACNENCTLDTRGCSVCGDGEVDLLAGETCDGGPIYNSLPLPGGAGTCLETPCTTDCYGCWASSCKKFPINEGMCTNE